jgi:hypothetical protein
MTAISGKLLSGLMAAMALVGMVTLLGIAANAPAFKDFFHAGQWTYAGIHETFLATVLLGLLLGWFFPAKVKRYCPALVVAPSVVLFLLVNFYLAIGEHKPAPQEIKLADCSGKTLDAHLTAPRGRHYVLFLNGLPLGQMVNGSYASSYNFTGKLRVTTDKSRTIEVPLDSGKMFVSPGKLDLGPINLTSGKDYEIHIEFNPAPPSSSFISLYWMQSYADRNN